MNQEVEASARHLTEWIQTHGGVGTSTASSAMKQLNFALGEILPDWFCELWQSFPLSGATATRNGLPIYLYRTEDMFEECRNASPGSEILADGFVCFAGDEAGTGDQIAFCVHEGDNPSVVSVCHETLEKTQLSSGLSYFFTSLTETDE